MITICTEFITTLCAINLIDLAPTNRFTKYQCNYESPSSKFTRYKPKNQ